MKTKLCDLLGCKYPIIAGAMYGFTSPDFVAAVSESGAVGTLTATACGGTPEGLREQIRQVKERTQKPFLVNVSLFPNIVSPQLAWQYFQTIVAEGVTAVETSGQSPKEYIPLLKEAGVKIFHKVPAVRYGKKVEQAGVDAVVVVGVECAGRPGIDEVSTLAMIPVAVEELSVPVIAGGGIASGKTLAAALALGAEGVVMGTRMLCTTENPLPWEYKQKILEARETDTVLLRRALSSPERLMSNQRARKAREIENIGMQMDAEELLRIEKQAIDLEDPEKGFLAMGQAAGQIHEVKPVRQVVEEINQEAEAILRMLAALPVSL